MKRWVAVDQWLKATVPDGKRLRFDNHQLAYGLYKQHGFRVSYAEASGYIQAYLAEQRHPDSYTHYWLHRRGRTSAAVWIAGVRTAEFIGMRDQYVDDVGRRIAIAVAPDLDRLRALNPKTRKLADKLADTLEEMMVLLRNMNGE